jgi:hypothetical protein
VLEQIHEMEICCAGHIQFGCSYYEVVLEKTKKYLDLSIREDGGVVCRGKTGSSCGKGAEISASPRAVPAWRTGSSVQSASRALRSRRGDTDPDGDELR